MNLYLYKYIKDFAEYKLFSCRTNSLIIFAAYQLKNKPLKNLSLALNIILVIAVGILYYLHFSNPITPETNKTAIISLPVKEVKSSAIAYINSDSLLSKYEYYKKIKADFELKQNRLEAELTSKEQALRTEAASYQQKAQTMTENELRELQERFAKKEQDILQYKDKKVRELGEEQQRQNELLYNKVTGFLKAHSQNKFKYVLGYSKDGSILYADDSLNITNQVIEGLNIEYKAANKK